MQIKSFHLTEQGASHIKSGKECQDASDSYQDEHAAVAVVCDGHGGDDYFRSAEGSKAACEAAVRNIQIFLRDIDENELKKYPEKLIAVLESSIIASGNESVTAHYKKNPFDEKELEKVSEKARKRYLQQKRIESAYGSTLIAAVVTDHFWFGFQIGDGKCVVVDKNGKFIQPIPWDEKCFLNATTSICDSEAIYNFRHYYSEDLPVAVLVGTDGIDDCFQNDEQMYNLYKVILYSFAEYGFEKAIEDLKEYLPKLSARGSGDDVSISGIIDLEKLGEMPLIKEIEEKNFKNGQQNPDKESEVREEEKAEEKEEEKSQPESGEKPEINTGFQPESGLESEGRQKEKNMSAYFKEPGSLIDEFLDDSLFIKMIKKFWSEI